MKRATKTAKAKRKTAGKSTRKAATKPARKAAAKATRPKKKTTKPARKAAAKATRPKKKTTKISEVKEAPARRAPTKPRGLKVGAGESSSRAEELRAILVARRAEIIQEIRRARQDSVKADRESYAEVGDLVSASVEKERAFEYGEMGVQLLREIDTALEKLEEGTFGICEMCGKPIGIRRLKVMPSARLCIKCKSLEEASGPGSRSRSSSQED